MLDELEFVLRRCSETASWFGVKLQNINSTNWMGDTPLHTICSWGDSNAVKLLIDAGADVNARGDRGAPPLFNAVIGGDVKVIKALIDAGAIPGLTNEDGTTAFEYAENIGASVDVLRSLAPKDR